MLDTISLSFNAPKSVGGCASECMFLKRRISILYPLCNTHLHTHTCTHTHTRTTSIFSKRPLCSMALIKLHETILWIGVCGNKTGYGIYINSLNVCSSTQIGGKTTRVPPLHRSASLCLVYVLLNIQKAAVIGKKPLFLDSQQLFLTITDWITTVWIFTVWTDPSVSAFYNIVWTAILEICVSRLENTGFYHSEGKKKRKHGLWFHKALFLRNRKCSGSWNGNQTCAHTPTFLLHIFDEHNWELVPWKWKGRTVSIIYNCMQ